MALRARADGNLWRETAPARRARPPLDGAAAADLIIIGGGFTGCAAALRAAERGLSTILLEAEEIGHGGSGRNVGLVNAGLWLPPEAINRALGAATGEKLTKALAGAPDLVFELIERRGIDCAAVRAGTLHCAHARSGVAELEERERQLRLRGAPVRRLSAEETAARTGAETLHGALFDPRAGVIQPLAYCRGLAAAAETAGARIFEKSPVRAAARANGAWRVETAKGAATASALLQATGAYHLPIAGAAPIAATTVSYFQIATAPLSPNLRASVLPGGEGAWDTAKVMSSFRLDARGRLLIGAVGALDHVGARAHRAWARRKLAALFPRLADAPLERAWFGRIAMTADHAPKILRLGPSAYAVGGYSGRGIGPGTLFGRAVADAIADEDEAALPLPALGGYSERLKTARRLYYEIGATLYHLVAARSPDGPADAADAPETQP